MNGKKFFRKHLAYTIKIFEKSKWKKEKEHGIEYKTDNYWLVEIREEGKQTSFRVATKGELLDKLAEKLILTRVFDG
jgi:hydrogenase maturation factor HypF (carbamoyltransferase family)